MNFQSYLGTKLPGKFEERHMFIIHNVECIFPKHIGEVVNDKSRVHQIRLPPSFVKDRYPYLLICHLHTR